MIARELSKEDLDKSWQGASWDERERVDFSLLLMRTTAAESLQEKVALPIGQLVTEAPRLCLHTSKQEY